MRQERLLITAWESIVYNPKGIKISTLFKPLLHLVSGWVTECSSRE